MHQIAFEYLRLHFEKNAPISQGGGPETIA